MLSPAIISALAANPMPWQYVANAAQLAMLSASMQGKVIRSQDGREIVRVTTAEAQALYYFAMQQVVTEQNNDGGVILWDAGGDCGPRGRGNF